jgi:hypothetical protein
MIIKHRCSIQQYSPNICRRLTTSLRLSPEHRLRFTSGSESSLLAVVVDLFFAELLDRATPPLGVVTLLKS